MTFTTRPTLRGTFGMVATTHWLASAAAHGTLERGGNAADAAVTAGFVLHLAEPHLNGPGGDLPLIHAPAGGTPRVLCGQGPAPARAAIETLRTLGFEEVPGSGPVAAAVPGAVDAWLVLLRDHGTMTLREVLAPAIDYARHGIPLVERVGETVAAVQHLFETQWPTSAALWLKDGRPPQPGELHTNPAWADVLERLCAEAEAEHGPHQRQVERARRAWSQGFVAEEIDKLTGTTVPTGEVDQPYLLSGEDMARFEAQWEEPARLQVGPYTILKAGLWTQGPVLLQALGMLHHLAQQDGTAAEGSVQDGTTAEGSARDQARLLPDVDTPAGAHAALEALALAMADREAWGGDGHPTTGPDTAQAILADLLDPAYLAERATLIGEQASTELRPGSPGGREPRLSRIVTDPPAEVTAGTDQGAGEPTVDASGRTHGDTCHIDVVDRWGNMVSATPSGGWLQSSPVIESLGFPLGSRLQMAWLEEGLASSLMPGRRPRTTLTPTLVLRDGEPWMACGTPGGDQQDQWQLVFLLRVLAGTDLQQAIDAPMLHSLSFPGSFWPRRSEPGVAVAEDRFDEAFLQELRRRGHQLRVTGPWTQGRLSAVTREADGTLQAAANPRGMQGYAVGR